MSTIIRTLPYFLSNLISKRKIVSPLRKFKYMVFGLSESLHDAYYKIVSLEEFHTSQTLRITSNEDCRSMSDIFLSLKLNIWLEMVNIHGLRRIKSECQFRHYGHIATNPGKSISGKARLHNLQIKRSPFDANNPFLARIITNKELHKGGNRSCLHVEFDISNSKMEYEAGDYVAVYPKNDSGLVERLGELTNTDLSEEITFGNKDNQITSYHTALSHCIEITAIPSSDVIMKLAKYCSNQDDKNKMLLMAANTEEGKTLYKTFVEDASRNIVHILEDIKSCKPRLDQICRLLPRLHPRYYSISSSPKLFPEMIHVTAVVVKYKTKSGRESQGVATSWLAGRKPRPRQPLPEVPIYIRKSEFRLPASTQTPIIMVGTGTGLAPFRGFLQERAHARWAGHRVGDTVLYFGCRHRCHDFIYQEELEEYEKSGLLKLNLAFSRDQDHKVYVTHLLEKNLEEIWDILGNQNGHFYVCGAANNMAAVVRNIVLRAMKEAGGKSDDDAAKFLNHLESTKKYCTDVWS